MLVPDYRQHNVFVLEPGTDRYLGRLCIFGDCPKGKRECLVPGCGEKAPRTPASTVCAMTCCKSGSPTKKLARLQEFSGPAQESSAGVGARLVTAYPP